MLGKIIGSINWIYIIIVTVGISIFTIIIIIVIKLTKKENIYTKIEKNLKIKNFHKALELSLKVMKEDNNNFLAKYYTAQSYEGLKDYQNALHYYESASVLAAFMEDSFIKNRFYLKIAELYKKMNKVKEALGFYLLLLEKEPFNSKALLAAAEILYEMKNYKKAVQYLTTYLKGNKDNLKAKYLLANIYYNSNMHAEAIKLLEELLHNMKIHDVVFKNNVIQLLADTYYATRNYNKGIEVLKKHLNEIEYLDITIIKLLNFCIKGKEVNLFLGMLNAYQNKISKELLCKIYYELGNFYFNENDFKNAFFYWDEAGKLFPNYENLKMINEKYQIFKKYPELMDIYSKDDKSFLNISVKLLKKYPDKKIYKNNKFWIFEMNNFAVIIYRFPDVLKYYDLTEIEKTIDLEFSKYNQFLLYSLFGIDKEGKNYLDKIKQGGIQLITEKEIIKELNL